MTEADKARPDFGTVIETSVELAASKVVPMSVTV
jgi:hypothetical protein